MTEKSLEQFHWDSDDLGDAFEFLFGDDELIFDDNDYEAESETETSNEQCAESPLVQPIEEIVA